MASFCAVCGNTLAEGERFCRVCGRDSAAPGAGSAAPVVPSPTPGAPATTSGKAIVSLVCGLLFFVPLLFVGAIVFGHLALSEIRKSAGRLKGQGIAIAGLVLGYLWIAGLPIMLIVAAIAIPNLLRARIAANESSAVASVRTLNVAEVTYNTTYPDKGFTCTLSELGGDEGGTPNAHQAMLIDHVLASGRKSGYVFSIQGCTVQNGVIVSYEIEAHPVTLNQTGTRAFCSFEDSVVRVQPSGEAVSTPAECQALTPLSQ